MGSFLEIFKAGGSHIAIAQWKKIYGPVFKIFFGSTAIVVVADPDAARQVMYRFTNHAAFLSPSLRFMRPEHRQVDDMGLVATRDGFWRTMRNAWQPVFAPGSLRQYADLMQSCARKLCKLLERACKSGDAVDVHDLLSKMTLGVVGECAYGVDFQTLDAEPGASESLSAGRQLVTACKSFFTNTSIMAGSKWALVAAFLPSLFPLLKLGAIIYPDAPLLQQMKARDAVIETSRTLMADWRTKHGAAGDAGVAQASPGASSAARPAGSLSGVAPGSFLGLLLAAQARLSAAPASTPAGTGAAADTLVPADDASMEGEDAVTPGHSGKAAGRALPAAEITDLVITAQTNTFILAGMETTANSLTYALYFLAQTPEVEAALLAEVDAHGPADTPITSDDKFPWADAVVAEAQRLLPAAHVTTRDLEGRPEGMTLAGVHVPNKTRMFIPIYAIHVDEEHWPRAHEFLPQRFMPEGSAEWGPRNPNSYVPFGGGTRHCIGYKFALLEARIALVTLYKHFTFTLEPGQVPLSVRSGLTLTPTHGCRMRVHPRLAKHAS